MFLDLLLAKIPRLRPPYRDGTGPIVAPYIDPSRRDILFFRFHYPVLRIAIVLAVVVLAAMPSVMTRSSFLWILAFASLYLGWLVLTHVAAIYLGNDQHKLMWLSAVRKGITLTGFTLFLWWNPFLSPDAWLLYLLPMLTLGVDLTRGPALVLVSMTAILAMISAFFPGSASDVSWLWQLRDGIIRGLLTGFIGFTTYLLYHVFAYQHHRSQRAGERLREVLATTDWQSAAHTVSELLVDLFFSEKSNITAYLLTYDGNADKMQIVGSSTPEGRQMVANRFAFPAAKGITGWSAKNQKHCFLNDTRFDPERRFLRAEASPDTRSALAVPFHFEWHDGAVLEVESSSPNDFAYEDLQIMNQVAVQLTLAHRQARLVETHQKLAQLGETIARRIIDAEEIDSILREVGEIGCELLRADTIRFHYHSPVDESAQTSQLRITTAGRLRAEPLQRRPDDPCSIVHQLMADKTPPTYRPLYIADAQNDPRLTVHQPWHMEQKIDPFVVREQIESCAVVQLVSGQSCLGLMWVNYRNRVDFERFSWLKQTIELVAPFAVLVLHGFQQSVLEERQRRLAVSRVLHDSLYSNLQHIRQVLGKQVVEDPGSEAWTRHSQLIMQQAERGLRTARNLLGYPGSLTLQWVVDDLQFQAEIYKLSCNIQTTVSIDTQVPNTPIGLSGGNELMYAYDQIIQNALEHGGATEIHIDLKAVANRLEIRITDNGCGFDTEQVGEPVGRGLRNIRARIQDVLGGQMRISSAPNQGTSVRFTIPLELQHSSSTIP